MEEKPPNPVKLPWLTKKEWLVAIVGAVLAPLGQAAFDALAAGVRSIPLSGASAVVAVFIARFLESLWAIVPAVFVFIVLRRHVASTTLEHSLRHRDNLLTAADLVEERLKGLDEARGLLAAELAAAKTDFAARLDGVEGRARRGDADTEALIRGISAQLAPLMPVRILSAMLLHSTGQNTQWRPLPPASSPDHEAIALGHHLGVLEIRQVGGTLHWRESAPRAVNG